MDRLMAILVALQQKPETAQSLANKFEVTKRTILRDMQSLSEMGIPLYSLTGPRGGFRLMEGFQLAPLNLDSHEALSILIALRSLTRMADTPFNQARWTAADKIKAIMPKETLEQIEPMLEYVEVEVPQRKVKSPHLSALIGLTAENHWIHVLYRSENHHRWLPLLPSRIYAAHGFWYCEAFSSTHNEQRTFRVDRFDKIELLEKPVDGEKQGKELEKLPKSEVQSSTRVVAKLTYRGALLAEQDLHIGGKVKQVAEETWELDFDCPSAEWKWAERFSLHWD
ncbi:WYL domain-containing protein [Paenibacillus sp. CC-CFT747]|nr:WYL domain-containing protein [Paenibacillus sp. CC-CFT747]